jgi:hypothetical protein
MRFLHLLVVPTIALACGGASGTGLDDGGNNTDGGGDGSTTQNDSSTGTDATTNPDGGPACPTESGLYSLSLSGAGCGDTATSGSECITQNQCTITLAYVSSGASGMGLKGTTPIQGDGSFGNGAIQEGSSQRNGCTGTWNQQTHTLVVDCGGTNTSQSCIATLVRTSETCK